MSELLHCPFCGGEASERTVGDYFQIGCPNYACLAYIIDMPVYLSRQEAVNDWNTRVERTITPVLDDHDWPVWRCPDCGQPINRADRYCSSCGAKMKVVE